MTRMRPEQQAAFSAEAQRGFEARAAAFLRGEFPERWAEASELEVAAFVRESQRRAAPYGLTTEQAVVSVACVRCHAGDDWSAAPWGWLEATLRDADADPNDRAKLAAERAESVALSRPEGG